MIHFVKRAASLPSTHPTRPRLYIHTRVYKRNHRLHEQFLTPHPGLGLGA